MLFGKNGKPSAEKLAAAAAEFYGDANKNKADKPAEGAVKDAVVSETEQKDAFIEPEQPGGDSAPEEEAVEYGTYERYIAEELLMKYENSKAYREGSSSRKIAVRVDQLIEIEDDLENEDEKKKFTEEIASLKEMGIVDYSCDKDDDTAIDRIWLVIDEASIKKAYKVAGRRPKIEIVNDFLRDIDKTVQSMLPGSNYAEFLKAEKARVAEKKDFTRYFFEDSVKNAGLLRFLLFLDANEENKTEQMERVLSKRLFADSKYFERELRGKAISILQTIKKEYEEGGAQNVSVSVSAEEGDRLLAEKGIVRYPEIFEFAGEVSVMFDDGHSADFSTLTYGACISALMAARVMSVTFRNVNRLLFIESKAVYMHYLMNQKKAGDLVLFHGGFVSPAKAGWFKCITGEAERNDIPTFFWGDIDFAGFRKFVRIKKEFCPGLKPYEMDSGTLRLYAKYTSPFDDESECRKLEALYRDKDYDTFYPVIRYMLENKVTLEQESIPVD